MSKIAESTGGFAEQPTDYVANVSGNKDLDGIRGTSQKEFIDDAAHKQKHQGDGTSLRRGQPPPATADFYATRQISQDQNQSLLSQDFVYLNENLAPRPGPKVGKKSQKDAKGFSESNQLRKVYGNSNNLSGFDSRN